MVRFTIPTCWKNGPELYGRSYRSQISLTRGAISA